MRVCGQSLTNMRTFWPSHKAFRSPSRKYNMVKLHVYHAIPDWRSHATMLGSSRAASTCFKPAFP